jgi:hypothetical protein
MQIMREEIRNKIITIATNDGYTINKKRISHNLDTLVFGYIESGLGNDAIKLDINYIDRVHLLHLNYRMLQTNVFGPPFKVLCLNPLEMYASKLTAICARGAIRDLFDVEHLSKIKYFSKTELKALKQFFLFYGALDGKDLNIGENKEPKGFGNLKEQDILRDLLFLIKKPYNFDFAIAMKTMRRFMRPFLKCTKKEKAYLQNFANCQFTPELIFTNPDIVSLATSHPLVQWRLQNPLVTKDDTEDE